MINPTGRLTPRRQVGMDNSRCGNVSLQLYADEVWSIGSKFDSFSLADSLGRDVGRLIPRVQNIFIFDTDNRDRSPATTVKISHNYGSIYSVTGGTPAPKGKFLFSKK